MQKPTIGALVLMADDVANGAVAEGWGRYLRALYDEYFVSEAELEPHLLWLHGPDYVGWVQSDEHAGYVLHLLECEGKGAATRAACLSAFSSVGVHALLAVYQDFATTLDARSEQAFRFFDAHNSDGSGAEDDTFQELVDRLAELDERFYAIGVEADALERSLISQALKQPWVKIVSANDWGAAVEAIGRASPHFEARRRAADLRAEAAARVAAERKSPGAICCAASGRQIVADGHIVRGCTIDGLETSAVLVITDREAAIIFITNDTYTMFPYRRSPSLETSTFEELEAWDQWAGKNDYRTSDGYIVRVPRA